jgi:hypothetical protein
MLATLAPHPDTPCAAITSISAAVARTNDGQLVVHYIASGDMDAVVIPPPVRYSSRADELWKTTCFEAFIQADGDLSYAEFNFAPSTAWAAYRFASYRADMLPLTLPAPHFDVDLKSNALEIVVAVDCNLPAELDLNRNWTIGLTAVIEELDGRKSYWALSHPPGKPDFHQRTCFVLQLPAAD